MISSVFTENIAVAPSVGSAIAVEGAASIFSSAFFGNGSDSSGDGAIHGRNIDLVASTIVRNRAAAGAVAGLMSTGGSLATAFNLRGNIVQGNVAAGELADCNGTLTSRGSNHLDACPLTRAAGDQTQSPPVSFVEVPFGSGPLAGATILALVENIGVIPDCLSPFVEITRDILGNARPTNRCDIGAFEIISPVIVETIDEPAGANCPAGGQRVRIGEDDGNGDNLHNAVLDSEEVDASFFVCDQIAAPPTQVTRIDVAAGCANGGIALRVGLDDNDNGVLDDVEIDVTQEVCNGAPGQDGADGQDGAPGQDGADGQDGQDGVGIVVTATPRAADATCAAGGIDIVVVRDLDTTESSTLANH